MQTDAECALKWINENLVGWGYIFKGKMAQLFPSQISFILSGVTSGARQIGKTTGLEALFIHYINKRNKRRDTYYIVATNTAIAREIKHDLEMEFKTNPNLSLLEPTFKVLELPDLCGNYNNMTFVDHSVWEMRYLMNIPIPPYLDKYEFPKPKVWEGREIEFQVPWYKHKTEPS